VSISSVPTSVAAVSAVATIAAVAAVWEAAVTVTAVSMTIAVTISTVSVAVSVAISMMTVVSVATVATVAPVAAVVAAETGLECVAIRVFLLLGGERDSHAGRHKQQHNCRLHRRRGLDVGWLQIHLMLDVNAAVVAAGWLYDAQPTTLRHLYSRRTGCARTIAHLSAAADGRPVSQSVAA